MFWRYVFDFSPFLTAAGSTPPSLSTRLSRSLPAAFRTVRVPSRLRAISNLDASLGGIQARICNAPFAIATQITQAQSKRPSSQMRLSRPQALPQMRCQSQHANAPPSRFADNLFRVDGQSHRAKAAPVRADGKRRLRFHIAFAFYFTLTVNVTVDDALSILSQDFPSSSLMTELPIPAT